MCMAYELYCLVTMTGQLNDLIKFSAGKTLRGGRTSPRKETVAAERAHCPPLSWWPI